MLRSIIATCRSSMSLQFLNTTSRGASGQIRLNHYCCSVRTFSNSNSMDLKQVSYEDVVSGIKNKKFLLIDVRKPDEVAAGCIPGSKAVPVDDVEEALKLDASAFEKKYGFKKPSPIDPIVTYCRLGGRASKFAEALVKNNYKNVSVYKGSWAEWSEKHPEDVKSK